MNNFYKHDLLMASSATKKKIIPQSDLSTSVLSNASTNPKKLNPSVTSCDQDSYLKYLSTTIYEIQLKKFYSEIFQLSQTYTANKTPIARTAIQKSPRIKTMKRKSLVRTLQLIPLLVICLVGIIYPQLSHAQESDTAQNSKVYTLGHTLPMEIWDWPLYLFNHPQGKEVSRLKDYKHKKLIVIDFWSTWCGTCLFTMPRTYEKLAPYTNSIELMPVTTQSIKTIEPIWKISKYLQSIPEFYSVVDQHSLKELFGIPHYPIAIIINTKGEILFYDKPSKITDELLHNLLDKEGSI
jgi:thiol-disulfide isomerase/thioredoxin